MANTPNVSVNADPLSRLIADVFISQGVRAADAQIAATSLVHADLEGIPSHGVALVPMYVSRLQAKSINAAAVPAPAPGGAERVVGNNPLAIAFPAASGAPLVVDMAMSATAMGKIRLAEAQGLPIPPGWATNTRGEPTTSPQEAIDGMLLPAGGAKGFGLALAIDLLCGALSGGGVGAAVRPLYAQIDQFYNCAHAFIAIDARRTNRGAGIASQVAARADDVRRSKRAAGTERLYAPGDIERSHLNASNNQCLLTPALVGELRALAAQAGSNAVV